MGKIVRFYQTEDGKTPVKDFLRDYLRRYKRHE
jgi:hypothetical protein